MLNEMTSQSHPWHDVPTGRDVPEVVDCIIEIPEGSKGKYELRKDVGLLEIGMFLTSILEIYNGWI
jgi:inorganic pyrophosphatase